MLRQAFLPAEKLARGAPLEHASADSAQAGFVPNQFQNLSRSGAIDLFARRRLFRDHDGRLKVFEQGRDFGPERYPNGVPTVAETLHAPVEQQRRALEDHVAEAARAHVERQDSLWVGLFVHEFVFPGGRGCRSASQPNFRAAMRASRP